MKQLWSKLLGQLKLTWLICEINARALIGLSDIGKASSSKTSKNDEPSSSMDEVVKETTESEELPVIAAIRLSDIPKLMFERQQEDFMKVVQSCAGAIHLFNHYKDFYDGDEVEARKGTQLNLRVIFLEERGQCVKFLVLLHRLGKTPSEDEMIKMLDLIGASPKNHRVDKAMWELYGGGSLEHMTPQGRA